jgi:hypothetical protein
MKNRITASSLEELTQKTQSLCKNKYIENLHLTGLFNIDQINSNFIKLYTEKASEWQAKERPINLHINHGEYIHQIIDGKEFVIGELKNKKYSNRACISLIDMNSIVESKDNPIPSFLIAQFGFSKKSENTLLVTLYYRALEVGHFLPINLAECCIYVSEIKKHFPDIENFLLNIHAFRAQLIPGFHCLEKAEIDYLSPIKITKIIYELDINRIKTLLFDKLNKVESVIDTSGLNYLYEAFEVSEKNNELKRIKEILQQIIEKMSEVKKIRENTSYYEDVELQMLKIKELLKKIIKELELLK